MNISRYKKNNVTIFLYTLSAKRFKEKYLAQRWNIMSIFQQHSKQGFDNEWSLWPFVNKIEQSVINFSQSMFLSSHFIKFWHKNHKKSHNLDILLSDTNVIFLLLGCGLFFSRYSLSSANKTEEGKEMFKCQIYA